MADIDPWCAWFDNDGRDHRRPPPRMIEDPALGACLRYAGGVIVLDSHGTAAAEPPEETETPAPVMTWVPDATTWPALNAASNTLRTSLGADQVRLRYYISGWAEEDLPAADIFERLDYIEEIARHPVNLTPRIRPLPASSAEEDAARAIEAKVRRNLVDDIILYDVTDTGRLRYDHVGARTLFARVCTPEEVEGVVGQDVLIDPADNGFGDAVTRAYRTAIESNRPIVDLVTAPVRLGGRERRWLHYKRITVPLLSLGKLAVFTDPEPAQKISFE